MYNKWNDENRMIHFVQDKKNKVKFGVLLGALNIEHEHELWFPGFLKPANYYNKKQWELCRCSPNCIAPVSILPVAGTKM